MICRWCQIIVLGLLLMQVGACASSPKVIEGEAQVRSSADPWEPLNRGIYAVSDGLDTITLKPLAKGYKAITPGFVRRGISNFFANLGTPLDIINNLLQGKGRDALSDTARLVMNSTVGIGGLFDPATSAGLVQHDEDFGQTLAKWGVPNGPYVMVPVLGPRTLRDLITVPLDIFLDPLFHYENSSIRDKLWILQGIHLRAKLLAVENLINDSFDPYITIREAYLQNREFRIYDGDPPEDDDDLFDEFFEEE
ncbi:MAG: VacJ family lipoprotein [Proteobacteria bacterium]|nr:VacJ family lipoprotein [Pseudomonadota bacterium]